MIRQIVACDAKRGIAKAGGYPWHLPKDGEYFRQKTMTHGGVVLMGRKTYDRIGHPLQGRQNFVLSHKPSTIEGVAVVTDLADFLRSLKTDLWIIGGSELYTQTISISDELYITEIDADFGCDTFYPEYTTGFKLSKQGSPHYENGLTYHFQVYIPDDMTA